MANVGVESDFWTLCIIKPPIRLFLVMVDLCQDHFWLALIILDFEWMHICLISCDWLNDFKLLNISCFTVKCKLSLLIILFDTPMVHPYYLCLISSPSLTGYLPMILTPFFSLLRQVYCDRATLQALERIWYSRRWDLLQIEIWNLYFISTLWGLDI